ncbi:MAG: DsbC family protein [Steroidobacteraceae bacterium]
MNKIMVGMLAGLLALGLTASSGAQDSSDATARIQKTLQARFPKLTIEKIQPSQWPWLYEVVTDDELFYTDTTGDYVFYGKVLDTKTREDLTAKRWNDMLKVDFNSLPLNLALKSVKGTGSRKLVVFADPHCPYCVRFEKTLQEVTNVTVYTFLYPLESIHPGATEKAKQIWCTPDRQAAWSAWMNNKKEPTAAATSCKTDQLNTLIKLGEQMKVTGTPTLIFEDGHRIPGSIAKDQLEEEFSSVAKTKS